MGSLLLALMVAAAIAHLLLAGAGTIRLAVQLPARYRLGPLAFANYSRAADMGRGGLTLYPLLGIGGPLAAWAALGIAYAWPTSAPVRAALIAAAVDCVLHSFTTAHAAPAMRRIGQAGDQAEIIAPFMETFTRWSWPRTILQAMTAVALMTALLLRQGRGAIPLAVLILALLAFTAATILAGAALDQVVVQLPAGRKIGTAAYVSYLRAVDLKNGRAVYPLVGLTSNAALIATLAAAVAESVARRYSVAFAIAAVCGITALLVTARTIPAARELAAGAGPGDAAAVGRLTAGARIRAPLFLLIFTCLLWALVQR